MPNSSTSNIPETPKLRSCNRHNDCDAADKRIMEYYKVDAFWKVPNNANFHCHDDECDECFGN